MDAPWGTLEGTQTGAVSPAVARLRLLSCLDVPFCDVLFAGPAAFGGRVGG